MVKLLTPKDLADAIGVSESSLRRWVDGGRIAMSRTVGGHRRIPVEEAIRFIRETGATVARPEILGVEDMGRAAGKLAGTGRMSEAERLLAALTSGERKLAAGMMAAWYVEGRGLAEIFDGPVRWAMERLGELWKHEERGILVEHRGTEIVLEGLREMRGLLAAPRKGAAVALGGAPEGDLYQVPSTMAGMVLMEAGMREINYGANTPVGLLAEAAREHGAKVVWVSVSGPVEERRVRREMGQLAQQLDEVGCRLVIGGRYANEVAPRGENVKVVGSMAELAELGKEMARPRR